MINLYKSKSIYDDRARFLTTMCQFLSLWSFPFSRTTSDYGNPKPTMWHCEWRLNKQTQTTLYVIYAYSNRWKTTAVSSIGNTNLVYADTSHCISITHFISHSHPIGWLGHCVDCSNEHGTDQVLENDSAQEKRRHIGYASNMNENFYSRRSV